MSKETKVDLRAAFVDRDDAFAVYGTWHQHECARVLKPNAPRHDAERSGAIMDADVGGSR